jgi:hypothetical protein
VNVRHRRFIRSITLTLMLTPTLVLVAPVALCATLLSTSAQAAQRPATVIGPGTTIVYTSDIADDQRSSKLSLGSHVPAIGDQITIQISLFGMDPEPAMLSDNNGHVYVRDAMESYLHVGGDGKDASVAVFRTVVTRNSAKPFTVTFDPGVKTAGDLPGRWWTWGLSSHSNPAADPVEGSATAHGVNSTRIPAGTVAAGTGAWIAFSVSMNRGHDTRPVKPPAGWTAIANNSEDSRHQSGHAFFLIGSAPGDVAPVANVVDIADGQPAEITGYRAMLIVYKLAPPAPPPSR